MTEAKQQRNAALLRGPHAAEHGGLDYVRQSGSWRKPPEHSALDLGMERGRARHLMVGELVCAGADVQLVTLLGSCVSVTLWQPELRLGGMCHGLVPTRGTRSSRPLDAKFTDEAVEMLFETLRSRGAAPQRVEAKVFGGGNVLACSTPLAENHVGRRNVEAARRRLELQGIRVVADDVLGCFYRVVSFDIGTGQVWVRRKSTLDPSSPWRNP